MGQKYKNVGYDLSNVEYHPSETLVGTVNGILEVVIIGLILFHYYLEISRPWSLDYILQHMTMKKLCIT